MARRTPTLVLASLLTFAVLGTACGDGSEDSGDAATGGSSTTSVPTSTTPAASTPVETTTPAAPRTTGDPEPTGPEPLPLEDIPALVTDWGTGTGEPLALAEQIIAFPLAIPTPDNTTPLDISVDLSIGEPGSPWEWDWSYSVLTSDTMPDIDIHADEPSPGNVALREFYDPIMESLGWSYSNSTGSDPGEVGGPNSINHVYQSDEEALFVNGLSAIPKPAFVWADEEMVFNEGTPGYRVDTPFALEPGLVPVPLIQTILDELPEVDGAELLDIRLASARRSADSFDAEYGLRYFEATLQWSLPADDTDVGADAAKEAFSTGLASSAFFAGEESFFDPGFLEPVDPRVFDDDWTQPIVFLDRYRGTIEIDGNADDGGDGSGEGGATVTVRITFEPNRPELTAPSS